MGMSAQEVDKLSLWQFMAMVDGHIDANTSESDRQPTMDEVEFLREALKTDG